MLQVFRNWPNATTATICAAALVIVFVLSIATAPADRRTASANEGSPSLAGGATYDPDSGMAPHPASRRNWFIDHSLDLPLNLP